MSLSSINSGAFQPSPQSSALPARLDGRSQLKSQTLPLSSTPTASTSDDKRQSALQLVTRTLTQAYEKIASKGAASTAAYTDQEPLTATKAANNILGFIERRLKLDAAEGATQEQLQSRLEAGLEGFKKGFAEATEQLKALSQFSPDVAADVADTYKQVLSGVDALRAKFITDATTPSTTNQATTPTTQTIKPDIKAPSAVNNIAVQKGLYEYAEARDFKFELTTKEGDKVSIRASSSIGASATASRDANGVSVNGAQSSSSNFELSIDGDLNEKELSAINDLLGHVDKLAGQFYAGSLDNVFDKAVSLGYDDQQIVGYSLHLSQVQIQQVAETYSAFAPDDNQASSLANQLAPLGNFIKDVFATLNIADQFSDPHKLLLDLSKKMAESADNKNETPSALAQFLERILAVDLPKKADEVAAS